MTPRGIATYELETALRAKNVLGSVPEVEDRSSAVTENKCREMLWPWPRALAHGFANSDPIFFGFLATNLGNTLSGGD